MITPDVIGVARRGRAATVEMTEARVTELARAFVAAWDDLAPEFRDAFDRLVDDAEDGVVTAAMIARAQQFSQRSRSCWV